MEWRYLDEKFIEAVKFVVENKKVGITILMKNLHISNARATRILEDLEEVGLIEEIPFPNRGRPRNVYISSFSEFKARMKQRNEEGKTYIGKAPAYVVSEYCLYNLPPSDLCCYTGQDGESNSN